MHMVQLAFGVLENCFADYDTFSIKDQNRLLNARNDGTLRFFNLSQTKDTRIQGYKGYELVAYVKASKQHYVGMIVGKKGSNIMQMRNQTNTDVQNPQQDAEPIFKVYGENYKDLAEMALWILEQDDRLSGKDSSNGKFKTEARIWCCSKYVGLLVGPNGGTIRQIMENSGCSSIQSPPRNEKMKYFTLTDLIGREDFDNQALEMNYNYNSPIPHNNIPCLKATPSIHGSRVFGGNANTANNSCHSSPFNPPSPISISPETSMNNNYLIDDFVRMLLMECQKIQVNQDRTIKTASSPHGNNVSSTYSCPSFMNGAIGSSNNLKRIPELKGHLPMEFYSELSRMPRETVGGETNLHNFFNDIHF
ncbi:hypothetical protein ACHWQZ_G006514 [Mnemiopsis leidyi]